MTYCSVLCKQYCWLVLGGTAVLPRYRGDFFSRYQYRGVHGTFWYRNTTSTAVLLYGTCSRHSWPHRRTSCYISHWPKSMGKRRQQKFLSLPFFVLFFWFLQLTHRPHQWTDLHQNWHANAVSAKDVLFRGSRWYEWLTTEQHAHHAHF